MLVLRHDLPSSVFVPFEWTDGRNVVRNDFPRFKEPEEVAQYIMNHPHRFFVNGKPVLVRWVECRELHFINEYLQGVGSEQQVISA